jgi:hypothetical protein
VHVVETTDEGSQLVDEFVALDGHVRHLAELGTDHDDRNTGHVADQYRPRQQLGQKADADEAGDETDRADEQRHRGGQCGVAARIAEREGRQRRRRHQGGRRLGSNRRLPRRAEHGVHGQRRQRSPQPDDRRQPRHRRVRHHLRDEVGGDGHPCKQVAAQPFPPITAELR